MGGRPTVASIHRDVGGPDYLGPFLRIISDELAKFGRPHWHRFGDEFGEVRLHRRVGERRTNLLAERVDDRLRRAPRRAQPEPSGRVVARHAIGNRRNVRQRGRALCRQVTRSVPIVFAVATDPVGAGYVGSLARPGGNATGFMVFEFGMSGKFLELLKEIAPNVTRAAIIRDATNASGMAQFGAIQAVAPSLHLEVLPVNMHDASEIEQSVKTFANSPNGGLVVTASAAGLRYGDLIVSLAARHKLPGVYWERFLVAAGGLISFGPDLLDNYRHAAGYVDRILKGEKPADLPVQAPTKYQTVINLKTAKALGLTFPPAVLARADEVIE